MMDLKTFIAETLQQICDDGIREAQSKEGGRAINAEGAKMQSGHLIDAGSYERTYVVEFRTAAGEALAISIPRTETAVIRYFQERMPYGLFVADVTDATA